ncbi:MAG TPA: hypothetical protein VM097_11585 [Mycobacteriales bacterium]|nr:hypothetical protein [Mycobacteriales bacterium]
MLTITTLLLGLSALLASSTPMENGTKPISLTCQPQQSAGCK